MKILASDYDGTLKFGESVLDEDIEAIRRWKTQGNLYVIVTGRSRSSIIEECHAHQIPADYYVTNNGGMVFDAQGKELLSSQMDSLTAVDLMFAAHETPGIASYVVNDGSHRHKVVVNRSLQDHRYSHIQEDWTEDQIMDSGTFAQINYSCTSHDQAELIADMVNQYFGSVVHAYANGFVVSIDPKDVSKATGLDFVASYADVDDLDVYAMGDSYSDIPMLESCYNSAAHALSPEMVKENAQEEYPTLSAFIDTIMY